MKLSKKTTYFVSAMLCFNACTIFYATAQRATTKRNSQQGKKRADTLHVDSLHLPDTVKTDTVARRSSTLDAPVKYEAQDSIVWVQGGMAHLYGEGKVDYMTQSITSAKLSLNLDSSTVHARGIEDSTGVVSGKPVFKDGESSYESNSMDYNFKSRKGFIRGVTTQQGEGFLTAASAKKGPDNTTYMRKGRYSTCDLHDHPHFYLELSMAKVRPKKDAVFGPAHLVVEDVHLPIAIPFGFFPFREKYSSGFIMPTYGEESNRGFYLRDMGYYWAISDKMDFKVLAEIFTRGSWGLSAASTYNKRYKYSGTFNASYLVTKTGDKGMPDYTVSKDFRVQWSHRQDAKAHPNSTFSASVNFATSSYDRSSLSSLYNPYQYSQNTKASSVSYSYNIPSIGMNITSAFNITQNTRDSSLTMTLPDLSVSISTFYPFKRKKAVGDSKWYEKIAVQYTGSMTNSVSTKDNLLFKTPYKQWRKGIQHRIPISATFSLMNYINIVPSFNYTERWYFDKVMRSYDPTAPNSVRKDTISGFNRVYNYNFAVSMNTRLYGMYKPVFMKSKEIQIRHVFSPQVSFSYQPNFGSSRYGYYTTYTYTDTNGNPQTVTYSPYSEGVYGVPSSGMSKNISFSIDNNIEMKYKSDKDTTGYKKISLIDQLGATLSYDFASRRWSDLNTTLRLKLSKSYTFSMSSTWATYAYQFDSNGNVVVGDRTEWSYGRFGRFSGYSGSFSYTLSNDTFKKWFGRKDSTKGKEKPKEEEDYDPDAAMEEPKEEDRTGLRKREAATIDDDGYLKFALPWTLNLTYSYTIREDRTKPINVKNMRYPYSLAHSVNLSGNIKMGSRWNINYSSGYDFTAKKLSMTTVNITRDLHCFNMSCGLVFGPFTSYNFSIRANASMLTDALKWDQRSNTGSSVTWY